MKHFRRIAPLVFASIAFTFGVMVGTPAGTDPAAQVATEVEAVVISFDVKTAEGAEMLAALDRRYPRLPSELPKSAARDIAFAKRCTKDYWFAVLIREQRRFVADQATPIPVPITGADIEN